MLLAPAPTGVGTAAEHGGGSRMIQDGDLVVIYERHDRMKAVRVAKGEQLQNRYGVFNHHDWIGIPYGSKVFAARGAGFIYLLAPTPELWTLVLPHRTQILYAADIALVVTGLELRPGSLVLESGTGSGSLTTSLARAVAPSGAVHTFDFHEARATAARNEFEQNGLANVVTVGQRDIHGSGFPAHFKGCADAAFLDLPGPWLVVPSVAACLRPDGRFCAFSPCIEQVQRTCEALAATNAFRDVRTFEVLLRTYEVRKEELLVDLASRETPDGPKLDAKLGGALAPAPCGAVVRFEAFAPVSCPLSGGVGVVDMTGHGLRDLTWMDLPLDVNGGGLEPFEGLSPIWPRRVHLHHGEPAAHSLPARLARLVHNLFTFSIVQCVNKVVWHYIAVSQTVRGLACCHSHHAPRRRDTKANQPLAVELLDFGRQTATAALATWARTWTSAIQQRNLQQRRRRSNHPKLHPLERASRLSMKICQTKPVWLKEPSENALALAKEIAEHATPGWSGFIRPVDKIWEISSVFGPRWGRHHNGVDLAAPTGEPVLAADAGKVTYAGWEPTGFGYLVEITHKDGWQTLYAHASEIYAWEGKMVNRGDCIASVGETGRATGPHLHWEIRNQRGCPVNPSTYVDL
eukprot:SM000017S02838  [mRNA]  locus=s17:492745:497198:- [translate_table: standard]